MTARTHWRRRASIASLIFGVLGVACSVYWISGDWERFPRHTATSTTGEWTAQLHFLGEGDSVPYGQQLVIYSGWSPLGRWWSTTLFRGACNGQSSLEWSGATDLVLSCEEFRDVEIQEAMHENVLVEYVGNRAKSEPRGSKRVRP